MANKLLLGVNIDHVATIRQARRTAYPDVIEAAEACRSAGAQGITAHLREDRRHIQDADIYALKQWRKLPLNMEMANAEEIVQIALAIQPAEVCLVPERRQELTTEGGLDVVREADKLRSTVASLSRIGTVVSLFIAPNREQIAAASDIGAPVIELHTGTYCDASPDRQEAELVKLIAAASYANELGLRVNAGHGINLQNLPNILQIPYLHTLNIGHSLVARAIFVGLTKAVKEMLKGMKPYRGGKKVCAESLSKECGSSKPS